MTINQTSSSSDLWQLLQAAQATQTSATSSLTPSTGTSQTSSTGDSSNISDTAKLLRQLEQLSKSNPAEFKKVTSSIAQQLTQVAKNSTDPSQAAALNQVAADFSSASTSGSFSDILPKQTQSQHTHAHDGDTSNPVANIFSQALQQIQKDLQTTTTAA